jgi:urea transport system permease protein
MRVIVAVLAALLLAVAPVSAQPELRGLVDRLAGADSEEKLAVAALIAEQPGGDAILEQLARGSLYLDRRSERVVCGERSGSTYRLSDPVDGSPLGEGGRRDVRRLSVDNALRAALDTLRAVARLNASSPEQRRAAIGELLANPVPDALSALERRRAVEPDAQLREALDVALALAVLAGDDGAAIASALPKLAGRIEPSIRAALADTAAREDLPPAVRAAARELQTAAEQRLRWLARAESVFFGLSLGSVLLLSAIGLAIAFGLMGVINMAHGELIMLGAYCTWLMQQALPGQPGLALLLSLPVAFLATALIGWVIERGVIRFLYGRPLETLLATFGISLILQQAVRSIFSPLNRAVEAPPWLSGSLEIVPGLALTYNRIAILFFALAVFLGLWWLMRRTALGLQLRAVAQNRAMARALGVRSARIDALSFALGSGIAGVAGVALSQLTNVGPNLGQAYIIDSFLVVVFGGVGNLWGTLVAAFTLGIGNKLLEPATGAVLAKILLLLALILFLQRRPQGLFPRVGRRESGE